MAETLFEELKRYVGFGPADEAALRMLHPLVAPEFLRIADIFYARILTHEGARDALQGGESQVGRLKVTLIGWLDKLLGGPWDEAYYELRARIGRVHVQIDLPQHYMFGAMNIVRQELSQRVDDAFRTKPEQLRAAQLALGKILDLELAVMLHTYREDMLARQARQERLATFGQLVGSLGHELRNPLGVIESSLFILNKRIGEDERVKKHVLRIGEQLTLANTIITDLLDMIRDRPLSREMISVARVVERAVERVLRGADVSSSSADLEALPTLQGDASQLQQVFVNLLDNAVQAAGPGGRVRIGGTVVGSSIEIAIEDDGPGVDVETRRRLFEPLVTTKAKGVGLGLALVKRIVDRHGGQVRYEPALPRGARFVVRLPVAP